MLCVKDASQTGTEKHKPERMFEGGAKYNNNDSRLLKRV